MKSRLDNLDKPSSLPSQYLFEITDVFNAQYKDYLNQNEKEVFELSSFIWEKEALLVLTLKSLSKVI